MSAGTYLLFVIFFAIIADRNRYVGDCSSKCSNTGDWFKIHRQDSYVEFWAAAVTCFLLGGYQLAASVVLYNQLWMEEEVQPKP